VNNRKSTDLTEVDFHAHLFIFSVAMDEAQEKYCIFTDVGFFGYIFYLKWHAGIMNVVKLESVVLVSKFGTHE